MVTEVARCMLAMEAKINQLQAELGKYKNGFWGRACARLSKKNRQLNAEKEGHIDFIDQLETEVSKLEKQIEQLQVDNDFHIGTIAVCNEGIIKLQAELDSYRWIPVAERLPEKSGFYQVLRHINPYPSTREYCALQWISNDVITHWKPIILPEPEKNITT